MWDLKTIWLIIIDNIVKMQKLVDSQPRGGELVVIKKNIILCKMKLFLESHWYKVHITTLNDHILNQQET